MLGIDYADPQTGAAMELVDGHRGDLPAVADPGGDAGRPSAVLAAMGLPISVFVDADGKATVVPGEIESRAASWSTWSRSTSGSDL